MTTTEKTSATVARVLVTDQSNEQNVFQLSNQEGLIVGRSPSCTIRLDDESVSERHCMFRFTDGEMKLNDWHSELGTIVNGEKISAETTVSAADKITIGRYQLRIVFHNDSPNQPAAVTTQSEKDQLENSTAPLTAKPNVVEDQLRLQLDQVTDDNRQLRDELEELLNLVPKQEPADVSLFPYDGFQDDEVEMLRAEVAQLQSELAQRDIELAELASVEPPDEIPPVDDHDTEALVARLEHLLEELQGTDRRIRSLQDLLRASDDAHEAELEERRQIDMWLKEIEQRVSQRESEWKNETQKLSDKIAQLKNERESVEQKLGHALLSSGNEAAQQAEKHLVEIREENKKLAHHLQQQLEENAKFRKLTETVDIEQNGESTAKIYQKLRQQELELAQERAKLSRQRAEFARIKDEVEKSAQTVTEGTDSSDVRVKALRDHLREIHEQEREEKQNQPEIPSGGIASRIARLWQRLDSR